MHRDTRDAPRRTNRDDAASGRPERSTAGTAHDISRAGTRGPADGLRSRETGDARPTGRSHPVLALQRTLGNRAVQGLVTDGLRARWTAGSTGARGGGPSARTADPDSPAEREADRAAGVVARGGRVEVRRRTDATVARQERPQSAEPTEADLAEFREERRRFRHEQEEYFRVVGDILREAILSQAGISGDSRPSTPEEALQVVGTWGVTIDSLEAALPELGASLSGRVSGRQTAGSMAARQQRLVESLSADGQRAYRAMLERVREESFWAGYLDRHEIYVFPDLQGTNRYRGYTQRGTTTDEHGFRQPVYVIHVSRDRLEAGQVEESAAILVHELSHAVYEPAVVERSLDPFLDRLAELLAAHPRIAALRADADDPDRARRIHERRIQQLLFERTGYAEEEIFVHLQQLTHQPDVSVEGREVRGSHYILGVVERYVGRLRRIGLPRRMLRGILDSLARRVARLYDRRIEALPEGSRRRRLMELNKRLALRTLRLARSRSSESETE